jgi:hypothetical protein
MKKKIGITFTLVGIILLAIALFQVYVAEFNITSLKILSDDGTAVATITGLFMIIIGPRMIHNL